jgi:hypothetical protein
MPANVKRSRSAAKESAARPNDPPSLSSSSTGPSIVPLASPKIQSASVSTSSSSLDDIIVVHIGAFKPSDRVAGFCVSTMSTWLSAANTAVRTALEGLMKDGYAIALFFKGEFTSSSPSEAAKTARSAIEQWHGLNMKGFPCISVGALSKFSMLPLNKAWRAFMAENGTIDGLNMCGGFYEFLSLKSRSNVLYASQISFFIIIRLASSASSS